MKKVVLNLVKKVVFTLVVLILGLSVEVRSGTMNFYVELPVLAVLLYGILLIVTLHRIIDRLPGAFSLRKPLGTVKTGYGYLWLPAVIAGMLHFDYTGPLQSQSEDFGGYLHVRYASGTGNILPAVALGLFILLMLAMKLHAVMAAANRLQAQGDGAIQELGEGNEAQGTAQ